MKQLTLVVGLLASLLIYSSCKNENSNSTEMNQTNNTPKNIVAIEGRENFDGSQAIITPLPAIMIATYDENDNPDVMMAAWGGQCGPKHICFNLSPHRTTDNLQLKKACTVSFASVGNVAESDFFGIISANKEPQKVAKAGFTATKSPNVDAPIINEYPLTLECVVIEMATTSLNETRVVCEVVNMSADKSILNEDGKVDIGKLKPVVFDSANRSYRVVGEEVGTAWGSGKSIIEREVK